MLGKERNNDLNDPDFIDQAWSEMANMLDREMPVSAPASASKSSRYGLLLLVLLIGFASGIGTMFFLQTGNINNKQIEEKRVYNEPVANRYAHKEQLINTTESDQLINENIQAASIENSIQKQLSNPTPAKANAINNSKRNINEVNLYTNSSSVITQQKLRFPKSNEKNTIALNTNSIDLATNYGGDEIINLPTKEYQGEKDYRPVLLAAQQLETKEVPLLAWTTSSPRLNLTPLQTVPKMNYGIYFGTQTRNFDGLHGLTTGFYASYRLDSKFSLRTGLGYSIIKGFQARTIGIAEPLTPEFFDPIDTNLDDYSTVSSLENNQDLPFQSLHYLDLPVGLDYRMADNFGILMGLKFSYLLNAKTDGYFSNNLNQEEAARLDDALYNSLRKMDVATVLGFGFYPSSNIGIELKYNHGLVDYTKDENWHIRQLNTNKTFELSMNYFLR